MRCTGVGGGTWFLRLEGAHGEKRWLPARTLSFSGRSKARAGRDLRKRLPVRRSASAHPHPTAGARLLLPLPTPTEIAAVDMKAPEQPFLGTYGHKQLSLSAVAFEGLQRPKAHLAQGDGPGIAPLIIASKEARESR